VAWPASEAPEVLKLYRTLAEAASPELTLVTFMRPAPPAPWLPKAVHGKLIVAILACHSGAPEQGEKAIAPIKAFGKPLVMCSCEDLTPNCRRCSTEPSRRQALLLEERIPGGRRTGVVRKNDLTRREIQSPHSAVILFQIAGH